jgi:hypothetical protein
MTYLTSQTSLCNQENMWARAPVLVADNHSPSYRKSPPEPDKCNAHVELYFLTTWYSFTFLLDLQVWISSAFFPSSINYALRVSVKCCIAETFQIAFPVSMRLSSTSSLSFISSSSTSSSSFPLWFLSLDPIFKIRFLCILSPNIYLPSFIQHLLLKFLKNSAFVCSV